jgi:hypothetical protein
VGGRIRFGLIFKGTNIPNYSGTISTPADPTTNRLTGYSYDAENRIAFANAGTVEYFYDALNSQCLSRATIYYTHKL